MRKHLMLNMLFSTLIYSAAGQTVVNLPKSSQKAISGQTVGLTDIRIEYHRPAVKGRKIWGELVPYGFTSPTFDGTDRAPWKTGANANTTITFSDDLKIEGMDVKAGTYGFFVAVHEDQTATVVLSKTNSAYGHYFYKSEEDVLRAKVNTKVIPPVELLTCSFDEVTNSSTTLSVKWETKEIPVRFQINVTEIVTASLIERLKQSAAFSWHARVQAARYLLEKQVHLDLALQWANEAIYGSPGGELLAGEKNFSTFTTQSNLLYALNNKAAAKEALNQALRHAGTVTAARVTTYAHALADQNRKEEARLVFEWAVKKWPDRWECQHGMARIASAMGRYKEALRYERTAYRMAPAEQKQLIKGYLEQLEAGKALSLR